LDVVQGSFGGAVSDPFPTTHRFNVTNNRRVRLRIGGAAMRAGIVVLAYVVLYGNAIAAPTEYAVDGLAVGTQLNFGSASYGEYTCRPSDQFDGFTWCQKTRKGKERRGTFSATYSILHSRDGAAVYVNRSQEPAFFGANEADNDIQRYSRKIGELPRITRMPRRAGFPTGILASWGKVELEPLDKDSIEALTEGRRPTTKGYFIDFIGDFKRSAKEGLPIYRLSGGAGFVWIGSFDQKGRGTLRLTAVDASALAPTTTPKPPAETVENPKAQDAIANTDSQLLRTEAEKEPADKARIDAERAREDAEKARDEAVRAKADIENAVATERAKVNAVLAQLQAEKGAAEAKARATEAEKEPADKARIDAERAHEDAEKARDEAVRAKADIENAVATERAKVNAVLAQLQAEKGAAEAKARAMEFVAYGAIIGLILLGLIIVSALVIRGRKTTPAAEHASVGPQTRELEPTDPAVLIETEPAPIGGSKTAAEHPPVGHETRPELEPTDPAVGTKAVSPSTGGSLHPEPKDSSGAASSSPQAAKVSASPRPRVILGKTLAGTLSAAAIGTLLYSKALNPYENWNTSGIAEPTKVPWKFHIGKGDMTNRVRPLVVGWQENERGALAEIIAECVNRGINIKVTVLGPDAEPTVELPWDNKLEDYRTEIGRFMEVVYLPITLKVNDNEPQIVKRLHEEPYRNVIRLVTLLSEPTTGSDPRQSMRETKTVSVQLDNLLSTEEKAALTSYYPDKRLKISEAKRIMVQFDTSKGTMLIKIMMDDPAIQKLAEFCQTSDSHN